MQDVIKNLKAGAPVSCSLQLNMMEWRDNKERNFVAKYVVTELAFVGTTITSVIEGVGAIVASLAVNGLNYVVPSKYNFNKKVVEPVLQYRFLTRMAFSHSIAALGYNVTTKGPITNKTTAAVKNFYIKLGSAALRGTADVLYAVGKACKSIPEATGLAERDAIKQAGVARLELGATLKEAWNAGIDAARNVRERQSC